MYFCGKIYQDCQSLNQVGEEVTLDTDYGMAVSKHINQDLVVMILINGSIKYRNIIN